MSLNPYIAFPGIAEEAMTFYQEVFGGDLRISHFSEYTTPDGDEPPRGVMHAMLATPGGMVLMASDQPPGTEEPQHPSSISLSLSGDDAEELRRCWDRLSVSGSVTMPLEEQIWGDTFGMCTDRFGVDWMVNITQVPVSA